MMYQQLQEGPQLDNPFTVLAKGLASLFSSKEQKVVSKPPIVEETPIPTITLSSIVGSHIIPTNLNDALNEVEYLQFLKSIKQLQETLSINEKYDKIYEKIPSLLVNKYSKILTSYINGRRESLLFAVFKRRPEDLSWEELLKLYMDAAANVDNPLLLAINALGSDFVLEGIFKVISWFKEDSSDDVCSLFDISPIKPAILSILWMCMLVELNIKATRGCVDYELERIIKSVIANLISITIGVTSYAHEGGCDSPTSILRTYYNLKNTISIQHPYLYSSLPDFLKLTDIYDFQQLTKTSQKKVGQCMNMLYTFRIGDAFITTQKSYALSSEDLKKIIRSVWSLPLQTETEKMFALYQGESIY